MLECIKAIHSFIHNFIYLSIYQFFQCFLGFIMCFYEMKRIDGLVYNNLHRTEANCNLLSKSCEHIWKRQIWQLKNILEILITFTLLLLPLIVNEMKCVGFELNTSFSLILFLFLSFSVL